MMACQQYNPITFTCTVTFLIRPTMAARYPSTRAGGVNSSMNSPGTIGKPLVKNGRGGCADGDKIPRLNGTCDSWAARQRMWTKSKKIGMFTLMSRFARRWGEC
jgi:hypothetical protein